MNEIYILSKLNEKNLKTLDQLLLIRQKNVVITFDYCRRQKSINLDVVTQKYLILG